MLVLQLDVTYILNPPMDQIPKIIAGMQGASSLLSLVLAANRFTSNGNQLAHARAAPLTTGGGSPVGYTGCCAVTSGA